jgi:tetratricopeptide (TPR) repeat protein
MVCQQHICFNHAVYIEDWTAAGKALKNIKMLHPTEGFLKEIVLHLSKEDYGAAFEQAKSCLATILVGAENCEHYLRLLLLMAEVYMGSGQLHIALSYAKKSLADSRAHHLSSIETQSRLLLAQIWVQLGQPDKSLKLLTDVMIDVLSQGM